MTDVVKIATLNINGITSRTRVGMLEEYIRRHELDIIFLQEITRTNIVNIRGYETFDNIGTHMRGTSIVARKEFHLTNITTLLTGRAIAAEYKCIQLINIYAPSGTERRAERGHFYNMELPQLIRADHRNMVFGGDFNCIIDPVDTSGTFRNSRALANLIHGTRLRDTWIQNPTSPTYTHHSPYSATRIDRIYVSQELLQKKPA
jgi:exonuclease III